MQTKISETSPIRFATRWPLFLVVLAAIAFGNSQQAFAGAPEYMQLSYKVGQAYEIEGIWKEPGVFVAIDIEELPKAREPKLRGEIQAIDAKNRTVTLFGIHIQFLKETEFVDDASEKLAFDKLKPGRRIEITCKVPDSNGWVARKVTATNIKKSNKIKGTLSRVAIDGAPPDTLEISGLKILLIRETDVKTLTGYREQIKEELFGELAANSPAGQTDGWRLGTAFFLRSESRLSFRVEKELDLTNRYQNDRKETEPYLRMSLNSYLNPEIRALAQVRFRKQFIVESDQNLPSSNLKAEFTQLYLLAPDIGGSGLALQVGRQDFDTPREWLFDDYLDAARLYFFE